MGIGPLIYQPLGLAAESSLVPVGGSFIAVFMIIGTASLPIHTVNVPVAHILCFIGTSAIIMGMAITAGSDPIIIMFMSWRIPRG